MKRGITLLVLVISLISLASAEIIFTQPLSSSYNLGDSISVPIIIKTTNEVSGIFQMGLICNGTEINFYTTGIQLGSGEEANLVDPKLILMKKIIGNNKGECKIKAILNSAYALTSTFKITDKLEISGELDKTEIDAGEEIFIKGKVKRETGENSEGFIEANLLTGDLNEEIKQISTITNGKFNLNISTPLNLKAGNYFLEIKAYERDNEGAITNNGASQYNIRINQVPTNLELVFAEKEIMPGKSIKVNVILHDQTGEPINSTAFIIIKNSKGKIIEQKEISLEKSFELPINSIQPPEEWSVNTTSNELTTEEKIRIKENQEADIQIINKTIMVTNIGNVFYNKTVLVRIGDSPLNIPVELEVGESKKYVVKAPAGEYKVRISEGNKEVSEIMSLTGKAIGIEETSGKSFGVLFWILLIIILGIVAFVFIKKLYKKPFFGKMMHKSKSEGFKSMEIGKDFKMTPKTGSKAELSVSIKEGEKQEISVVCIKIKDLREMQERKSRAYETVQKIKEIAEENKAVVYESQDYLFLIFTPIRTKTLKNEKPALDIAEKVKNNLEEHNKMFNQKIDFGISVNYGSIVGKQEGNVFKFMGIDSVIPTSKKIASLSEKEILLSSKINDLLRLYTKTEKSMRDGVSVFSIKEVKKEADDATKKFINRFMERQKKY